MTERLAISPPAHERTSPSTSQLSLPARYARRDLPHDTVDLARFLIGATVVRVCAESETAVARIVETEAYLPEDAASHAFRGRTSRNAAMFGERGCSYVYFIYGNHFCFNVTSERSGVGAAVLVRAAEPIAGLAAMTRRCGERTRVRDLLRGPGRFAQALDIDRRLDGIDLCTSDDLWLAHPLDRRAIVIGAGPRIGITKNAGAPLRFFAASNPWVSRTKLQDSASRTRF